MPSPMEMIASRSTRAWIAAAGLALVALTAAACSRGGAPDRLTIAVIPKGTTHVFWQSIHAGASKAGEELGVKIVWRGPLREDDRDSQVTEVENAVGRGVAGHRARAARRRGAGRTGERGHAPEDPGRRSSTRASRATTTSASSPPTTTKAAGSAASTWRSCSAARARSSCCATPKAATARPAARRDSSPRCAPIPASRSSAPTSTAAPTSRAPTRRAEAICSVSTRGRTAA